MKLLTILRILILVMALLVSQASVFADVFVEVNQDASRTNDLICNVKQSPTNLGYIFNWYNKDGHPVIGLGGQDIGNRYAISSSYLTKGESWTCTVEKETGIAGIISIGTDSTVILNSAPRLSAIPDAVITEGDSYSYQTVAYDPDNDLITYSIDSNPVSINPTISIDADGLITWDTIIGHAGTYTIDVTVTDTDLAQDMQTYTITVLPGTVVNPLTVTASANPTSGYAPLTVDFSSTASGGVTPYTYSWDLDGDGNYETLGRTAQYTYTSAGVYTATVRVVDDAGTQATDSVIITVLSGAALNVVATANPTSGTEPLIVDFGSTVTGGTPGYTYSWNFGDGTPVSTSQNPVHTYASAGVYNAVITVTDSLSQTAQDSVTITVTVLPVLNVVVSAAPTSGFVPLRVNFNSVVTGGLAPYTYSWDVQTDGTEDSTSQNPSFVYTSNGTYTATLTVTDSLLNTVQANVIITVNVEDEDDEDEDVDEDDIFFESVILKETYLYQKDVIEALVTLENKGDYDFNDLEVSMAIYELGIKSAVTVDLEDDSKETFELQMPLPDYVPEGSYLIRFKVENDDVNLIEYREVFINKDKRDSVTGMVVSDVELVTQPSLSSYSPTEEKASINWLGVWFMLLVMLVLIALAAYLIRVLNKEKQSNVNITELDGGL